MFSSDATLLNLEKAKYSAKIGSIIYTMVEIQINIFAISMVS